MKGKRGICRAEARQIQSPVASRQSPEVLRTVLWKIRGEQLFLATAAQRAATGDWRLFGAHQRDKPQFFHQESAACGPFPVPRRFMLYPIAYCLLPIAYCLLPVAYIPRKHSRAARLERFASLVVCSRQRCAFSCTPAAAHRFRYCLLPKTKSPSCTPAGGFRRNPTNDRPRRRRSGSGRSRRISPAFCSRCGRSQTDFATPRRSRRCGCCP